MEKILIQYPKSALSVAQDIQSHIKKAGFASTLGCAKIGSDKNPPNVIIAVINSDSIADPQMVSVLDEASQKRINVVPYVCSKLEKSITANFFLDEHVWIDAVDQQHRDALGDLSDCLKNNFNILSRKASKKTDAPQPKAANGGKNSKANQSAGDNGGIYKKLFFVALGVVVLLSMMLVAGGGNMSNREASNQMANLSNSKNNGNVQLQLSQNLRRSEEQLVGTWVASGYNDNRFRATRQDSLEHQQLVDYLLSGNAKMIINANKTFSRLGFSGDGNPETGEWEYDSQSKYLKLKPTGINQYDVVQIQDITDDKMVIVVQEKYENTNIITKITFSKI